MLHNYILTAALAALLHISDAAPQPVPAIIAPRAGDLDSWVTVGSDGAAITIQPEVTAIGGNTKTISPAPSATYTTIRDGKTITTTGPAPVPTADNEKGTGSFVVCDGRIGALAPFCTPRDGSQLFVGNTYYITWDGSFFSNFSDNIDVEGYYTDDGKKMAFEHTIEDAGLGFFAWTVPSDILKGDSSTSIKLEIEYKGPDGVSNSQTRRNSPGPEVVISPSHSKSNNGGDIGQDTEADNNNSGTSTGKSLAIAIPIVVVAVLAAIAGFFLWKRKKSGAGGIKLGAFGFNRRSSGYGVRQSRAQRTGEQGGMPGLDNKGPAFQLQDSPTSPTGGNVFRDEMRRQDHS